MARARNKMAPGNNFSVYIIFAKMLTPEKLARRKVTSHKKKKINKKFHTHVLTHKFPQFKEFKLANHGHIIGPIIMSL